MVFFRDECGQGAAEYILLFGAIIMVAIAALFIYKDYVHSTSPLNAAVDVNNVRNDINSRGY